MLGENGTGKTTFIKMLAGLIKSDSEEKGEKVRARERKKSEEEGEWEGERELGPHQNGHRGEEREDACEREMGGR
jgi:ABC-type multidrug transport system ATPase subunit